MGPPLTEGKDLMFRNDAVANGCGQVMPASCKPLRPGLSGLSLASDFSRQGACSVARHRRACRARATSAGLLHEIGNRPDRRREDAAQQSILAKCPNKVRFETIPRARSRSYKTPTDSDWREGPGLGSVVEPGACLKCCAETSKALGGAREIGDRLTFLSAIIHFRSMTETCLYGRKSK